MAKKAWQERPTDIEITLGGKRHTGSWRMENGAVRVTLTGGGTKVAEIGTMTAEDLARRLLAELVAQRRPEEN